MIISRAQYVVYVLSERMRVYCIIICGFLFTIDRQRLLECHCIVVITQGMFLPTRVSRLVCVT